MSNLVLGNLYTLKQHLLGAALLSSTEFDAVLTQIGKGVAAQLEKFCNRKFQRTAGDTYIETGDRSLFIVPRYPIESVSAIDQKTTEADGFVTLGTVNSVVQAIMHERGIIRFGSWLGTDTQVRFTYTGGYFVETLEPADVGYPTAQPSGSTALPEDIRAAWLQQCAGVWQVRDKLGTDIAATGSNSQFVTGTLSAFELLPIVKQLLLPHRRFS